MPRTITDVQNELTTVNAAIQELIAGTRLTQLRVGSGDFARLYVYQELTLENLQGVKAGLLQELASFENTEITFRKYTNIPLVTTKFRT